MKQLIDKKPYTIGDQYTINFNNQLCHTIAGNDKITEQVLNDNINNLVDALNNAYKSGVIETISATKCYNYNKQL
jgi:ribosomal protein L1